MASLETPVEQSDCGAIQKAEEKPFSSTELLKGHVENSPEDKYKIRRLIHHQIESSKYPLVCLNKLKLNHLILSRGCTLRTRQLRYGGLNVGLLLEYVQKEKFPAPTELVSEIIPKIENHKTDLFQPNQKDTLDSEEKEQIDEKNLKMSFSSSEFPQLNDLVKENDDAFNYGVTSQSHFCQLSGKKQYII